MSSALEVTPSLSYSFNLDSITSCSSERIQLTARWNLKIRLYLTMDCNFDLWKQTGITLQGSRFLANFVTLLTSKNRQYIFQWIRHHMIYWYIISAETLVQTTIRRLALSYCRIGDVMMQMNAGNGIILILMIMANFLRLVLSPYYLLLNVCKNYFDIAFIIQYY